MQLFESYLSNKQHTIFYQTWSGKAPLKGHVLITHGWNEHSSCYENFAKFLTDNSWKVWAYDLRGHGKSSGNRGSIDSLSSYSSDLNKMIDLINAEKKSTEKVISFAHSLGACINVLSWTKSIEQKVDALSLSSPAMGVKDSGSKWKLILAHIGLRYFPQLAIKHNIPTSQLTSDKKIQKNAYNDPYRHHKISPYLFHIMDTAYAKAQKPLLTLHKPTLIQASGIDKIVDFKKTTQMFEKIPAKSKHLKVYLNSEHEVLNDIEKEQVYTDFIEFAENLPQ
ncbi:MAG: alpha/beta hydrolase [Bdellovibrionaceae bacterium]|nr:alpha/beta hydrolase [Pseudobdellovibrionaceae bacterium]